MCFALEFVLRHPRNRECLPGIKADQSECSRQSTQGWLLTSCSLGSSGGGEAAPAQHPKACTLHLSRPVHHFRIPFVVALPPGMAAASLAARAWPSLGTASSGARGGAAQLTHYKTLPQAVGQRAATPAALPPAAAAAAAGRRRRCRPVCSSTSGSRARGAPPSRPAAAGDHLAAAAQLTSQHAGQPRTQGRQRRRHQQGATASGVQQSELEAAILRQRSIDGVLALLDGGTEDDMPPAAAAAALYQLNKLGQAGGGAGSERAAVAAHPSLPRLFRVLQHGAAKLHIRSLVSVLACCRGLGLRPPQTLPDELADQLVRRLPAVAPAQASNALLDLTRLGSEDGRDSLLAAVNVLVERQQRELAAAAAAAPVAQPALPPWLAQLTMAQLSSLLWVCAKAAFRSQPLLHGITEAMLVGGGSREGQQERQRRQRSTSATPQPDAALGNHSDEAAGAAGSQLLAGLGPRQLSSLFYSLGALRWAPSEAVSRPLPSGAGACLLFWEFTMNACVTAWIAMPCCCLSTVPTITPAVAHELSVPPARPLRPTVSGARSSGGAAPAAQPQLPGAGQHFLGRQPAAGQAPSAGAARACLACRSSAPLGQLQPAGAGHDCCGL